jgi:RNA polymerase sigma-70 factor (ECF subfamily)
MHLGQDQIVRALLSARTQISAAAWVVLRDAQACEDIFQNVTVKALSGPAHFEREAQLISWAHVTARHEALNALRARKTTAVVLDSDVLEILSREWSRKSDFSEGSRVEALRNCMRKLPEASRRLLELRYFEELPCEKVSESVGVKLDAVYQRLARLHRTLKQCIQRNLETGIRAEKP